MKAKGITAAVFASTLLASAAFAAELTREDRQFIETAAKSGLKGADVSSSALPKLTAPAVREYAQMLVAHHSHLYEELRALAARKGVALPPQNDDNARNWARNDKDVAQEYVDEMVVEHREAVKLFDRAAQSADPDIAAFAQKALPKLRQQLELAQTHRQDK